MSDYKASRISEALKEEEPSQHQLLPFTIAAVEASPSFQASNLFNSSHTNIELSEFSEQYCRQPGELFSLQAKKYSSIVFYDQSSETISNVPIKWMSSKMRLMRKMMAQEQITVNKPREKIEAVLNPEIKSGNISPSGTVIRVCSVCNTTKTPLWRSGPQGPKSLCNACGIRQMKARRAAAAAAAAGLASTVRNKTMIIRNEKKVDVDLTVPYKKRYKFANHGVNHKDQKFGDSSIGLRESSSAIFHSAFPQDEKDAAILLMALSFG